MIEQDGRLAASCLVGRELVKGRVDSVIIESNGSNSVSSELP